MKMFNRLFEWLFIQPYNNKEIEDFLSESVDHADLESRIRFLQRQGKM